MMYDVLSLYTSTNYYVKMEEQNAPKRRNEGVIRERERP